MEKIGTKHPHLLSEFKFAGRFYKHFLIMLVGLIILNLAARFIVTSASNIARIAGVAESFIGGTIISICATLPELSIALESIREGHVNLGIGDTVGECLTNSTLALGLVLLLSSFSMDRVLSLLMIFFLFSVALLCFFLTTLTRGRLEKVEGFFLLIVYLLFLTLSSVLSFFA
jgi:cation:H+ antiporter